jgi:hypothetical protein
MTIDPQARDIMRRMSSDADALAACVRDDARMSHHVQHLYDVLDYFQGELVAALERPADPDEEDF